TEGIEAGRALGGFLAVEHDLHTCLAQVDRGEGGLRAFGYEAAKDQQDGSLAGVYGEEGTGSTQARAVVGTLERASDPLGEEGIREVVRLSASVTEGSGAGRDCSNVRGSDGGTVLG